MKTSTYYSVNLRHSYTLHTLKSSNLCFFSFWQKYPIHMLEMLSGKSLKRSILLPSVSSDLCKKTWAKFFIDFNLSCKKEHAFVCAPARLLPRLDESQYLSHLLSLWSNALKNSFGSKKSHWSKDCKNYFLFWARNSDKKWWGLSHFWKIVQNLKKKFLQI